MNKEEKSSGMYKIDKKWTREEKRAFCEFPAVPYRGVVGEEEVWLELVQFFRDDLKWLLSLDHHKFWSHMIYSEKAHGILVSFFVGTPPNYMKHKFLVGEEMKNIFAEVERLVFLVFLRLSSEKESEGCFVRNFGDVLYNNYLFTVPVILDICLIYGGSNHELVKNMINNIITAAPYFLDDFQEIIPHFIHVLKIVREKFSLLSEEQSSHGLDKVEDLVLFLCDSVANIQAFLEVYPYVCQLFSRSELVNEIVVFYSNILPEVCSYCRDQCESSYLCEIIENVRVDTLKIVKSIFDFIANEANETLDRKEETVNEYLSLMEKLLLEPAFFSDYNLIYSVEFELECVINNCENVNLTKVNAILEGVTMVNNGDESKPKEDKESGVKLNSLITEIMDIFPHLEESFVKRCLSYYNNNTERVIAAILENQIPPDMSSSEPEYVQTEEVFEFKRKHRNLKDMLNDKEEINKMRERYAQLSIVADDTYDDEYDDTYDENLDVAIREGDEIGRRPFVVPRILRTKGEIDEEEEDEEEEEEEEEVNEHFKRNHFVENPAVIRERLEQKRSERRVRDYGSSRGRGWGQSKEVLKNRDFKESHKSFIANHNRKKQATRKMGRGMIPS